jgi:hypothetical protein
MCVYRKDVGVGMNVRMGVCVFVGAGAGAGGGWNGGMLRGWCGVHKMVYNK